MTRISLAFLSLVLVLAAACGGDDKKGDGGGIFSGGSGSSGGASSNDPAVFAKQALLTLFNVFGGSTDPQKMLDLYAPECRAGVKASDIAGVISLLKLFAPEISKLKLEDVDLGNPKIDKQANGQYKVSIPDPSKVRFKVDGKFVRADEFLKQIGLEDLTDDTLSSDEPLTLKEVDGKLYIADCDDLKDLSMSRSGGPSLTPGGSSAAVPTPPRGPSTGGAFSAAATPRSGPTTTSGGASAAAVTATPGRTATSTANSAVATVSRGTPTASSVNIVRITPTSSQRYPAAIEQEFMGDCTGAGSSTTVCRCMFDILQARYTVAQYREFEREIDAPARQPEVNGIIRACVS